ncbi:hypothetical protein, partial [Sansalvadorimonas verongulae]|uniref:hypothetical protein n=1 Tax=Sansalvadorimonas verongulae TaxID=2172824 RepID=UPI001E3E9FAA
VNALVDGEYTGMGERLVALVTDVGPLPCVDALVSRESTGLSERPVASVLVTDKGLHPSWSQTRAASVLVTDKGP